VPSTCIMDLDWESKAGDDTDAGMGCGESGQPCAMESVRFEGQLRCMNCILQEAKDDEVERGLVPERKLAVLGRTGWGFSSSALQCNARSISASGWLSMRSQAIEALVYAITVNGQNRSKTAGGGGRRGGGGGGEGQQEPGAFGSGLAGGVVFMEPSACSDRQGSISTSSQAAKSPASTAHELRTGSPVGLRIAMWHRVGIVRPLLSLGIGIPYLAGEDSVCVCSLEGIQGHDCGDAINHEHESMVASSSSNAKTSPNYEQKHQQRHQHVMHQHVMHQQKQQAT